MNFVEFKQLNYPPDMPMEYVLADILYQGKMDVNTVLSAYTHAIERERNDSSMRFEESCVCLNQFLSGNFTKKKDKEEMTKRMLHIYNKTKTLVPHIYDKAHGYTAEDDKRWEDFCQTIYGSEL